MKAHNIGKGSAILLLLLFFVCSMGIASSALAVEGVGDVISLKPGAFAMRGGKKVPLQMKSRVHQSDVLMTDATGKVQVILDDDTTLSLAPSTSLELRTVVAEGKPEFNAHMSQGLARFITGKIVEKNPKGFTVTTPEGTVGIRGTMFGLHSYNGRTRVSVINSSRGVLLNGMVVPPGSRMDVGRDFPSPTPVPLTEQDVNELGQQTGTGQGSAGQNAGGGSTGNAGGGNTGDGGNAGGGSTGNAGGGNTGAGGGGDDSPFSTADLHTRPGNTPPTDLAGTTASDLQSVGAAFSSTAVVSAENDNLYFGFTANLLSGAVSDGWIFQHSGRDIDYINGSGTISVNTFHVSNFSLGAGNDPSNTVNDAAQSSLSGSFRTEGNLLHANGVAQVYYDNGNFSGERPFSAEAEVR